ncbi:MAG: HNH endonuclease [Acidimicrobiaceae bacterium]|nr:HNH endonuclease [Acidimicrobiaceae bacterium]
MEQSPCPRCGKNDIIQRKRYAVTTLANVPSSLFRALYNVFVFLLRPAGPTCSWCWAYLTPRARREYQYDPFVAYQQHDRYQIIMRERSKALRPHPVTARWQADHRLTILAYIAWRDSGRCGLCAMPLPVGLGNIEHIVPKKFGRFDHRQGRVTAGSEYESALHHIDNLQAAHDYCNRAKGNASTTRDWRHPELIPLPVARGLLAPHTELWIPEIRQTPKAHGPTPSLPPPPRKSSLPPPPMPPTK